MRHSKYKITKEKYQGDARYERVHEIMQLLGIEDVTTHIQYNNGTIVWRLPIKNHDNRNPSFIEVASFKTGYVRNQNSGYSNYQLNKRCEGEPEYFELDNGDYRKFTTRSCKLIPIEIDRLEYLISYCLKNYYIKRANQVVEGKYVSQWYHDWSMERANETYGNSHYMPKIDELETRVTNLSLQNEVLQNKLSNAISPTKHECAKQHSVKLEEKLYDLQNKLATINRISE